MILHFPGTKGEIEESSPHHQYHSSLVIEEGSTRVLIDYGQKHNPSLDLQWPNLDAMLITHAHPDHYLWTLQENNAVEIPVYVTRETLDYAPYRPLDYRIIEPGRKFFIKDLELTAYRVIHSLRCPAVCYKAKGKETILYAPDIVDTEIDKSMVFAFLNVLIADGSSLNINMVRRKDEKIYGHAMVKTIINWCKKYGLAHLIVTHCGKQILKMGGEKLKEILTRYGEGKVEVEVAFDGWVKNVQDYK
ncbi:MAG: MBL fold metallo-hydrolase [Actinomycetota bacterium]|nr:MBL fold metallo-hydrolase [Actinomycetota bacterium]